MKFFKKIFSILLRPAISIALLIFLFRARKIDIYALLESVKNTDKPFLFLAFFAFSLTYILCFLRWQMLLKAANIHLPIKRVIASFSGGIFFSLFLPSTIGGDFARSLDLSVHTKKPKEVVATVFLDRLSGYVGLACVVLFSLFFGWGLLSHNSAVVFSVVIIIGILTALLLLLFNNFIFSKINKLLHSPNAGRARQVLTNLHEEVYLFKKNKKIIFHNLALSVIIQIISPLISYIMALSIGLKINIVYFFVFLPIIGAITLLPISIGGLGLRENATVLFFSKVGVSEHSALLISLLSFLFMLIYGAAAGLIYAFLAHIRKQG